MFDFIKRAFMASKIYVDIIGDKCVEKIKSFFDWWYEKVSTNILYGILWLIGWVCVLIFFIFFLPFSLGVEVYKFVERIRLNKENS